MNRRKFLSIAGLLGATTLTSVWYFSDDPNPEKNWKTLPAQDIPEDIPEKYHSIVQKAAQYAFSFKNQREPEKVDLVSGMLRGVMDFYSKYDNPDVSPEEAFDMLVLKAEIESYFGEADMPKDGKDDHTGEPQLYGPYHFGKIVFARLLARYGPEERRNKIKIIENGAEIQPEYRKEILRLRNDPYIASLAACGKMKEAAQDMKEGWKLLKKIEPERVIGEVEINQINLYIEHVLGMKDYKAVKVIEAQNKGGLFHDEIGHESMKAAAEGNRSLFRSTGGWLSLSEVYDEFADRVKDRKEGNIKKIDKGMPKDATTIPPYILKDLFPSRQFNSTSYDFEPGMLS